MEIRSYSQIEKCDIKLYQIFTVVKGNRKSRWKIINHPNFPGAYAIVRDYPYLKSGVENKSDYEFVCGGSEIFKKCIEMAYEAT